MRISYEGDKDLCDALVPAALHAHARVKGQGLQTRTRRPIACGEVVGEVVITTIDGIDGVHIVARGPEDDAWPGIPSFLSGAVINEGQILNYTVPGTQRQVAGLDAFTPTIPTKEEYKFDGGPMLIKRLMVEPHVSMPKRIPLNGQQLFDSQYTSQQSSKYTGKMCKLVQVILSYGVPERQAHLTAVMQAYAASHGLVDKQPSILFSKENRKGIKNNFNFEYGRTNGVFTFRAMVEGKEVKKYWLVQVSQSAGVQVMPLQLEPNTAEPAFKAYINSLAAKDDHPKFIEDIKKVLDEFGGLPTNEGFLTKNKTIKKTIRTVLPPENLKWYKDGRGVSTDHGWAFNSMGTQMNNICLEDKGDGSWYVAHHCQITLGYDIENDEFNAGYSVIESGSAPIGKHYLKVGDTVLDNCVSYNADLRPRGDYSGRPRATATAMFVFYKDDNLQVLRWSEGHMDPVTNKESTTQTKTGYRTERWSGATGIAAGFYCTSYDGRIPTTGSHFVEEYNMHVANERDRTIRYAPSTDLPEYFTRSFHGWTERRTTNESGQMTHDSCAFIPLGDRSAFYIVSMVSTASKTENYQTEYLQFGDPYSYRVNDTYIWNFDFGTKCGTKYPFTYMGITLDGMANVVWDRGGPGGRVQLDHYCQYYVWAHTDAEPEALAAWTDLTGHGEWYDIGAEPIPVAYNPMEEAIPPGEFTSEPSITRLKVWMMSLGKVGTVFERAGSYLQIYRDFNYWFDTSPNPDGDFQTMWAVRNCLGKAKYQLYSKDVNDRTLERENDYPLGARTFPTFIGVVGDLTT